MSDIESLLREARAASTTPALRTGSARTAWRRARRRQRMQTASVGGATAVVVAAAGMAVASQGHPAVGAGSTGSSETGLPAQLPTPATTSPWTTPAPAASAERSISSGGAASMTVVTQPVQTPECRDVEAHLASLQGPAGYVRAPEITPEQFRWERGWVHAGGVPVSLLVSASCTRASALPPASRNGSVTPETIDGHRGWLLAEPALGYAEVTWNVNDSTQVTVAANGFHPASFGAVSGPTQEAQRLSDAELLAFARAAPTS